MRGTSAETNRKYRNWADGSVSATQTQKLFKTFNRGHLLFHWLNVTVVINCWMIYLPNSVRANFTFTRIVMCKCIKGKNTIYSSPVKGFIRLLKQVI